MSSEFVFVGPSLDRAEVAALRPDATILPPVEHGDLLRLDAAPGDRVLIIDGLFMRAAPVRHREILYLLEHGVTVAGSSSMGALRAAELWPFGMRGAGEVFRMYRDGVISGDDEVAIVHGPAEEGYRPLSVPLVNIRVALARAAGAGVVTGAESRALVELARTMPFRVRGYRSLEREARRRLPGDAIDRFLRWHRENPTDAKAEDARLLLSLPADGPGAPAPHGVADMPIDHARTTFLDSWRARHGGTSVADRWVPDAAAIAAVMLLHPAYPAEHRAAVLARIASAGHATPGHALPSTAAPGNATPDAALPSAAAPGHATPSAAAPGNATPSDAAPGNATPGHATPDAALPSNPAPGPHGTDVVASGPPVSDIVAAGGPATGPGALPGGPAGSSQERAALVEARRLGLLADEPAGSPAWDWLTPAERNLDREEALLRVLARSFGTAVHAAIGRWLLPSTLADRGILDQARSIAATAERLNDRLPRTDPRRPRHRMRFRSEVIDRTFAALWGCAGDDLLAAAYDHGFADLDSFRLAAEPLVAYVKLFGAPAEWTAPAGEAQPA